MRQRSGATDPLALAQGKSRGFFVQLVVNIQCTSQALDTVIFDQAQQLPRQADIVTNIEKTKQSSGLEYIPQCLTAQ